MKKTISNYSNEKYFFIIDKATGTVIKMPVDEARIVADKINSEYEKVKSEVGIDEEQ